MTRTRVKASATNNRSGPASGRNSKNKNLTDYFKADLAGKVGPESKTQVLTELHAGDKDAVVGTAQKDDPAPNVVAGSMSKAPAVGANYSDAGGLQRCDEKSEMAAANQKAVASKTPVMTPFNFGGKRHLLEEDFTANTMDLASPRGGQNCGSYEFRTGPLDAMVSEANRLQEWSKSSPAEAEAAMMDLCRQAVGDFASDEESVVGEFEDYDLDSDPEANDLSDEDELSRLRRENILMRRMLLEGQDEDPEEEMRALEKDNEELRKTLTRLFDKQSEDVDASEALQEENKMLRENLESLKAAHEALGQELARVIASLERQTRTAAAAARPAVASADVATQANAQPVGVERRHDAPQRSYRDAAASVDEIGKTPQSAEQKKLGRKAAHVRRRIPTPPVEFERIQVHLPGNRALARCSRRDKNVIIREMLRQLKINRYVPLFSLLGLRVLEVYYPAHHREKVRAALAKADLHWDDEKDINLVFKPVFGRVEFVEAKVVNRLGFLYLRARTRNMKSTIVGGLSEELKAAVIERAEVLMRPKAPPGAATS